MSFKDSDHLLNHLDAFSASNELSVFRLTLSGKRFLTMATAESVEHLFEFLDANVDISRGIVGDQNYIYGFKSEYQTEVPALFYGPTWMNRIKINRSNKSFEYPMAPGLHVIAGDSASGKSSFAAMMADVIDLNMIDYLEPTYGALMTEFDLLSALAMALNSPNKTPIVIDSLRDFVYSTSAGATGKGGTDMGLFSRLTSLDLIAQAFGVPVFAVINFLAGDEEQQNFIRQALLGSVTGVIMCDNPGQVNITHRYANDRRTFSASWYRATRDESHQVSHEKDQQQQQLKTLRGGL